MDPRVRRTRGLLEDALRSLLAERSYDAISVGDIAERATVNRATFYAHYEDKRHLATSLVRGDLERTLLAGWSERSSDPAKNLRAIATIFFGFAADLFGGPGHEGGECALVIGPTLQEALEAFLRTWLDRDPEAMRAFPGASRGTVATVLAWSLYGAALEWSRRSGRGPAESRAREIIALLVR